jgi:propanol-preferring alcohol dehydrogenase
MKAMLLARLGPIEPGGGPLVWADVPDPAPAEDEVLLRVSVCGVCHTELDEIEGRTPPPRLPQILGHQVVGRIVDRGAGAGDWQVGERVGVAWIFSACGACEYCHSGRENLCPHFLATGRDRAGGYAELMTARRRFPQSDIFVFARSERERELALELGAAWAGETADTAPMPLNAIIDTTPAWTPVIEALRNLAPGGRLVINAIRKEDADKAALARLDYAGHLWLEKEIKSVANVTRRDVAELLALAAEMRLQPQVQEYPLSAASAALVDLKTRPVIAAKVLVAG